jgi:hypothetical protein
MKMMIPDPSFYWSQLDESHFFWWVRDVGAINIVGSPEGLELTVEDDKFDRAFLYELIAALTRYETSTKCLRSLCLQVDQPFFENKDAYWYDDMFGDD